MASAPFRVRRMTSGKIDYSDAVVGPHDEADARTPELPIMAERPPRQFGGTVLACVAAIGLHGSIAAGLWFGITDRFEDIGGEGYGREAIGVELIDTKVLAALRPETSVVPSATRSIAEVEGVARPEVASTATADAATAKPEPAKAADRPDLVLPDFEEQPEPPTPDTLTIAKQAPEIEPTAAPVDAVPTAMPEASKVASLASPAALEAALGGSVAQSSEPAPVAGNAAAVASAGRSKAYGRDVMAALIATLPKPRQGFGTGTTGWLTGTVVIDFVLALDGSIERATVATSSGYAALDTAALTAVRQTRFPRPPEGLPANERWYSMPYYFR
jgi:periplasmic protein TonB